MILTHVHLRFIQRHPFFKVAFLIVSAFSVFTGCSTSSNIESDYTGDEVRYSIISVVHADADYLFHEDSKAKQADQQALNQSIEIAEKATNGEVFIFHQKPEQKSFLFFPKKDRIYYHYKNGRLLNKGTYSPEDGGFTKEIHLYKTLSRNQNNRQTYFAYFGHEIPTFPKRVYHRSSSELELNTDIFAEHLQDFSSDIALTILSTCNNGNPLMMDRLRNVTDVAIASPQNLHLSYLNIDKLHLLESEPQINTESLADSIAQHSFTQLSGLQTMVTVAVYSLDQISNYIFDFNQKYEQHLKSTEAKPLFTNNADCKNIDSLESLVSSNGVRVFYKPASFGRRTGNISHSGWGCKN